MLFLFSHTELDKLYDEFCVLRSIRTGISGSTSYVGQLWVECFKTVQPMTLGYSALCPTNSFQFPFPLTNASCDRVFSIMNDQLSDRLSLNCNCLNTNLVKAELFLT